MADALDSVSDVDALNPLSIPDSTLETESSSVSYQSRLQNLISHDSDPTVCHHVIQAAIMFLSAMSTDTASPSRLPFFARQLHRIVAFLSVSPTVFDSATISALLGLSLFVIILFVIFQLSIPLRELTGRCVDRTTLRAWLFLFRFIYPLPSIAIGGSFGVYLLNLTESTETLKQLFMSIACFVLWAWCVNTTIAALHHHRPTSSQSPSLQASLYLLPVLYSAFPRTVAALSPGGSLRPSPMLALCSIVTIVALAQILLKPSYRIRANAVHFGFVFLASVPFSALGAVAARRPADADLFLLACALLAAILAAGLRLAPLPAAAAPPGPRPPPGGAPRRGALFTFEPQDFACAAHFGAALLAMTYLNARAAPRMPLARALPDVVHRAFPIAAALRNRSLGAFQLGNAGCLLNAGAVTACWLLRPERLNVRRLAAIWATVAWLRAAAFTLTSLPAPCAGLPRCPCADPAAIGEIASVPPWRVAVAWSLGMGIKLKYPQCGDLIISGHTLWLWLSFRIIADFVGRTLREPFGRLVMFVIGAIVVVAMCDIVIVRNHYGVDVYFGLIVTELVWQVYGLAMKAAQRPASLKDGVFVRLIRWIETRKRGADVSRESSDVAC
jgi:hypothetical protein